MGNCPFSGNSPLSITKIQNFSPKCKSCLKIFNIVPQREEGLISLCNICHLFLKNKHRKRDHFSPFWCISVCWFKISKKKLLSKIKNSTFATNRESLCRVQPMDNSNTHHASHKEAQMKHISVNINILPPPTRNRVIQSHLHDW